MTVEELEELLKSKKPINAILKNIDTGDIEYYSVDFENNGLEELLRDLRIKHYAYEIKRGECEEMGVVYTFQAKGNPFGIVLYVLKYL